LVKFAYWFGFSLEPIFYTVSDASKNDNQFKSGQKRLENNHLAPIGQIYIILRGYIFTAHFKCCLVQKNLKGHNLAISSFKKAKSLKIKKGQIKAKFCSKNC
jgi:hypothetical protein